MSKRLISEHFFKYRKNALVVFGYDGSRFYGLQPQKDVPSAGQALRKRLESLHGFRAKSLAFSARTDRGVHARRNFATCYFSDRFDHEEWAKDVMRQRDDGLIVERVLEVPKHVHARACSAGKHYRYLVRAGVKSPTKDLNEWQVAPTLDCKHMQSAASMLEGEHDFASFRGRKCNAKSTIKNLYSIQVTTCPTDSKRIVVDVHGSAFLRYMIRNLVGLLVEIGSGWRRLEDIPGILAAKSRQAAGIMAPGSGLTLMAVGFEYPDDGRYLLKAPRAEQTRDPLRS